MKEGSGKKEGNKEGREGRNGDRGGVRKPLVKFLLQSQCIVVPLLELKTKNILHLTNLMEVFQLIMKYKVTFTCIHQKSHLLLTELLDLGVNLPSLLLKKKIESSLTSNLLERPVSLAAERQVIKTHCPKFLCQCY